MRETGGGNAGRAWGAERLDTQRGLLWRASDVPAQLPRQLRGVSEKEGQKPAHRLRAGSLARSTGCRRTERLAGRFYPLNTGHWLTGQYLQWDKEADRRWMLVVSVQAAATGELVQELPGVGRDRGEAQILGEGSGQEDAGDE